MSGAVALAAVAVVGSPGESPLPVDSDDLARSAPPRLTLRRPAVAHAPVSPRKKAIKVGLLGALGGSLIMPEENEDVPAPTGDVSREARTVVVNRRVALTISGPDRWLAADLRQLLWSDGEAEQCAASRAVQPLAPLEVKVAPSGEVISVSSDALELTCEREVLRRATLPITPEGFTFRLRWSRRWP